MSGFLAKEKGLQFLVTPSVNLLVAVSGSNRRPNDYELQIGVLRKGLKTGWFLLSALFTDSFRRSINSTNSVNSALLENF